MKEEINLSKQELIEALLSEDVNIREIFSKASNPNKAREKLFDYLNVLERDYFNIYSHKDSQKKHEIEKNFAKECVRVFKNIIRTENEELSNFSALDALFKIYKNDQKSIEEIGKGFIIEFLF